MNRYRSWAWRAAFLAATASSAPALGQPEPAPLHLDLEVKRAPAVMPASLAMRTPTATSASAAAAPSPAARAARAIDPRSARAIFGTQPLSESVIFRFNVGVGLDGGQPAPDGMQLSGLPLTDYAELRIYYFGDAVLGSRGILSPSLSTYLASRFRFDVEPGFASTAIPSVHDALVQGERVEDVWVRSAYATWQGVGEIRALAPLYLRAGRQYRYGPAIAHFDGITVGYHGRVVDIGLYTGRAVEVTGLALGALYQDDALISGIDVRVDLYPLQRVPLALTAEFLRFDATTHARASVALRLARDVTLGASVRTLDGAIARTGAQLKARTSKVATFDFTVENRTRDDWLYDLFAIGARGQESAEREPVGWLRLGPALPRWYVNTRAGIVLLDNIDLFLYGGGVLLRALDSDLRSGHAASYAQAGGAVEIRLRRALGLGVSLLVRRYGRGQPTEDDDDDVPGALAADTRSAGERSFVEGGGTLRYTQGARRFSASAEAYLRYYDRQSPYRDVVLADEDALSDARGGGRFTVEGWAGDNLRLKAEYDLSTTLAVAPALSGIKSLRILAEGRF